MIARLPCPACKAYGMVDLGDCIKQPWVLPDGEPMVFSESNHALIGFTCGECGKPFDVAIVLESRELDPDAIGVRGNPQLKVVGDEEPAVAVTTLTKDEERGRLTCMVSNVPGVKAAHKAFRAHAETLGLTVTKWEACARYPGENSTFVVAADVQHSDTVKSRLVEFPKP